MGTSGHLPHHEGAFSSALREALARVRGPVGCLLAILFLPIAAVVLIVTTVVLMWKTRRLRRDVAAAFADARARAPQAAPDGGAPAPDASQRELAVERFVAAMALDETFTLDDARQSGALASAGLTADDLLAEAERRGWVERRPGGRFAVTRR